MPTKRYLPPKSDPPQIRGTPPPNPTKQHVLELVPGTSCPPPLPPPAPNSPFVKNNKKKHPLRLREVSSAALRTPKAQQGGRQAAGRQLWRHAARDAWHGTERYLQPVGDICLFWQHRWDIVGNLGRRGWVSQTPGTQISVKRVAMKTRYSKTQSKMDGIRT